MTASVSTLLQEAMHLSAEMRIDLAEQLIESAAPSAEAISDQMKTVRTRMRNVESGLSQLVDAEEAHRSIRESLAARA